MNADFFLNVDLGKTECNIIYVQFTESLEYLIIMKNMMLCGFLSDLISEESIFSFICVYKIMYDRSDRQMHNA